MQYHILSKSSPGLVHTVNEIDGIWECDCTGFRTGGDCRHCKLAKQEKSGQFKEKIVFMGHNPLIRQMRTDMGWRVEIDLPQSEYDNVKNLPHWQELNLKITIEKEPEN